MKRRLISAFAAVVAMSLGGACAGVDSEDSVIADAKPAVDAVIIDVRTPEEFELGHLEGAVLINFKDASFDAKIAELDPNAEYIVYCRSGNRSAQAAARMREAGIGNIVDLGSLENASAKTGIDIVTD